MGKFTHLHVHTQYSLLDGAARINDLVARAKELGMEALAITDHGAMYGVIDFYKACRKAGLKPILGMEAYVAINGISAMDGGRDSAHLVLLAKNYTGYKNLMRLSSIAFVDGFYYKPRIDYDILEQHSEGLVCLSACLAGDIPRLLLQGQFKRARALAERLKGMFGEDFYIELQDHGIMEQRRVLPLLEELAKELNIRTVITNDVHYVNKDDAAAHDVLLCIQTQKTVDDADRMRMESDEFYLKTEEELKEFLPGHDDAYAATAEIADKCNVEITFGERHLPEFHAPEGMTNLEYLTEICRKGLQRKMPEADDAARERLEFEISVISQMGFVDYFLIVWDFVNYAHEHGIYVGPGRGSGAGSLAAYAMDITDIDPLKYDLVFERFLNPERVSMPDFDIDFCIERRQEVIDYVARKYGADHVCQIITFGTMAARMAVRDVGRALNMQYADVDRIAKLIPAVLDMNLTKALEVSPELKALYDTDPATKHLLDVSLKLEGLPRHASTHAAGVVICGQPTVEYVPLQRNEGIITTQFPKDTVEELGLLKMDFLGLRTLTVIRDTIDSIKAAGLTPPDMSRIPYDDPEVYKMIAAGETDGVFQLESTGMRQFMMELKPDCFEDIIAGISLYRPGPMDSIPRYIAGKNNKGSVVYADEKLRPILQNTYGCMVYQEQVMQIVRDLAGYSWGRSDLVRRAMAKKKHDVMAKEREYFVHGIVEDGEVKVPGAVRNGVPEAVANQLFDEMMDFASYAFNKSHAAAYAVVGYRTAFLKRYYPVHFMTALLNSFLGNTEKSSEYINYCRQHNISVLPPDINHSQARFAVEGNSIRIGFAAIKNVSEAATELIVKERKQGGAFKDFHDLVNRGDALNKRMIEGLIKAGCFDSMGYRRAQLLLCYEQIINAAASDRKTRAGGQISLFDTAAGAEAASAVAIALPDVPELERNVLLAMEKEVTGVYISGHPLYDYRAELDALGTTCAMLMQEDGSGTVKDNSMTKVGGIITAIRTRPTKSGSGIMAFVTIEDLSGTSMDITVFPRTYTQYSSLLREEGKVIISGKFNVREDQGNTILAETVVPLIKKEPVAALVLRVPFDNKTYAPVSALLRIYPGESPVMLDDITGQKPRILDKARQVQICDELLDALRELVGEENISRRKL